MGADMECPWCIKQLIFLFADGHMVIGGAHLRERGSELTLDSTTSDSRTDGECG